MVGLDLTLRGPGPVGLDLTLQVLFGRVGSGRVRFRAGRVRSDDPTGAGRVR